MKSGDFRERLFGLVVEGLDKSQNHRYKIVVFLVVVFAAFLFAFLLKHLGLD